MSAPKADDGDARVSAVLVVGSLHYDIMVDAPDRPRKGEIVAGHSWSPKFGGKGVIRRGKMTPCWSGPLGPDNSQAADLTVGRGLRCSNCCGLR
jgi:hypothetical protein